MALRSLLSKFLGSAPDTAETIPAPHPQPDSAASATAPTPAEPLLVHRAAIEPAVEPLPDLQAYEPTEPPPVSQVDAEIDDDVGIELEPAPAENAARWVYDPALFGEPMPVTAFLGAQRLTTAAEYRADLDTATRPAGSPDPEVGGDFGMRGFSLDFAQNAASTAAGHPSRRGRQGMDTEAQAPLFIIGNAPEAADRLAVSLIQGLGMAGAVQGRLLPLAYQLVRTTAKFYRTSLAAAGEDAMIRQVEAAVFQRAIRRIFAETLAAQYPGAEWVDNTQGFVAIQSVTTMRTIWPRARFIFVASRMMESVAARAAEADAHPVRELVTNWTREMQVWMDTRERLGKACITLDARELHARPGAAASAIVGLLAHDGGAATRLTAELMKRADDAGNVPHPLSIADLKGDSSALREIAQPMMDAFGYGWESYFKE